MTAEFINMFFKLFAEIAEKQTGNKVIIPFTIVNTDLVNGKQTEGNFKAILKAYEKI